MSTVPEASRGGLKLVKKLQNLQANVQAVSLFSKHQGIKSSNSFIRAKIGRQNNDKDLPCRGLRKISKAARREPGSRITP